MKSPPEAVIAALPGTLPAISAATGYPPGQVLRLIGLARRDGAKIIAVGDDSIRGVPAKAKPEPDSLTTVYTLEERHG